ncbi:hypothetical protein RCCGEPOP_17788, partial [Rhizobium sp. Pop5]
MWIDSVFDQVWRQLDLPSASDCLDDERFDDQRLVVVDKAEARFMRGIEARFQGIAVEIANGDLAFSRFDAGSTNFQRSVRT